MTTAYNWQNGVSNRASDYYFLSIADNVNNPANLPEGTDMTRFVDVTKQYNSETLLTASTIGYLTIRFIELTVKRWTVLPVPNNNRGLKRCGYSVTKYGTQTAKEPGGDCGSGTLANGMKFK